VCSSDLQGIEGQGIEGIAGQGIEGQGIEGIEGQGIELTRPRPVTRGPSDSYRAQDLYVMLV